jgi:hypothetical protein
LGFAACGDDRANDVTPGNVVLAERAQAGWRVVAVESNTNVRGCNLSRRPDRTLLVCHDNVGAFGDGALDWRFTLDFSRPFGSRITIFAKWYLTPDTSCSFGSAILVERGATYVEVLAEQFDDTDHDGDEELTLTLQRAHVSGSRGLGERFDASCKRSAADSMVSAKQLAGTPSRFTLKFSGEATTLAPTVSTQQIIEAWGREAPEFWWKLK